MIRIYTSPSCSSCRKVKKWFMDQNIPFEERNIFSSALNDNELMDILSKSENGTDDIISPRSKIVKEAHVDFDDMRISEVVSFIKKNPSILKRPIMVDDRRIQVGYNEEEIRSFIPPEARKIAQSSCERGICPLYDQCEHAKDQLEEK